MKRARVIVHEGSWPDVRPTPVFSEELDVGVRGVRSPDTVTVHQRGCDDFDCLNYGCLTIHLEDT